MAPDWRDEDLDTKISETFPTTLRELFMAKVRIELYSAIQHPDMKLREAVWDLIDEVLQIRPAHDPRVQTPD